MFRNLAVFCLSLTLLPSLASAVTVTIKCSDFPTINCAADYTVPANCTSALQQAASEVNKAVCCDGSPNAMTFNANSVTNPCAALGTLKGRNNNKHFDAQIDKALHCNLNTCPKASESEELTDMMQISCE